MDLGTRNRQTTTNLLLIWNSSVASTGTAICLTRVLFKLLGNSVHGVLLWSMASVSLQNFIQLRAVWFTSSWCITYSARLLALEGLWHKHGCSGVSHFIDTSVLRTPHSHSQQTSLSWNLWRHWGPSVAGVSFFREIVAAKMRCMDIGPSPWWWRSKTFDGCVTQAKNSGINNLPTRTLIKWPSCFFRDEWFSGDVKG